MVETIGTALGLVVAALALVVGLNLMMLALMRAGLLRRSNVLAGMLLGLVGIGGAAGLWAGLGGAFEIGLPPLPWEFKISAVLLYLSGCLSYLEIKSLVSRSCSLRILVDLADAGGQAGVEKLKFGYGGGLGIQGLLLKRVRTMADLGLLRMKVDEVGPLSQQGRVLALAGHWLRQLLRLESVG